MTQSLILENIGWKEGPSNDNNDKNWTTKGFQRINKFGSPNSKWHVGDKAWLTLVILRNSWMRKIYNYLLPWYFWIIYMEVCAFIHQIFANIYTRWLSEGKKQNPALLCFWMAYILIPMDLIYRWDSISCEDLNVHFFTLYTIHIHVFHIYSYHQKIRMRI